MENSNGNKVTVVKVKVEAKDNSGNILGTGECKQYSRDQEGLNAAIKEYGYEKIVGDLNRQIKTDTRNALARGGPSVVKEMRDTRKVLDEKTQEQYDADLKALMEKYRKPTA